MPHVSKLVALCECWSMLQVKSVEDVLAEGDVVNVMCIGRDARGHVKVSRRALLANANESRQSKVSSMLGMAARS